MLIFDLEIDVVVDRDERPHRVRTHYARVAVPDSGHLGFSREENEARNIGTAMGHARGGMVADVRITHLEA